MPKGYKTCTNCSTVCKSGDRRCKNCGVQMLKPPLGPKMEEERLRGAKNKMNKKARARWSAVQDLLLAASHASGYDLNILLTIQGPKKIQIWGNKTSGGQKKILAEKLNKRANLNADNSDYEMFVRVTERVTERESERVTERESERVTERESERESEQVTERESESVRVRETDTDTERTPGRDQEEVMALIREQVCDRLGDGPYTMMVVEGRGEQSDESIEAIEGAEGTDGTEGVGMTKGVDMTEQTDSVESDEMADGVEVTTCEELAEGTGSVEGAGVTDGELGPDQGIPELIIKDRKRKRVTEYLTKWKGYEEKHNSWEVEEHFAAGCNVLACYKKAKRDERKERMKKRREQC